MKPISSLKKKYFDPNLQLKIKNKGKKQQLQQNLKQLSQLGYVRIEFYKLLANAGSFSEKSKHIHREAFYSEVAAQKVWVLGSIKFLEQKLTSMQFTILKPQTVPSAAGINFVSHLWPTRWHQSDLQMS